MLTVSVVCLCWASQRQSRLGENETQLRWNWSYLVAAKKTYVWKETFVYFRFYNNYFQCELTHFKMN